MNSVSSKLALLLTGPNASGKTTALKRAAAPWAYDTRVRVVHGDSGPYSKDSPAATEALLSKDWTGPETVLLIEGIDRIARAAGAVARREPSRAFEILVTRQSPAVMLAHLAARCATRGKPLNAPYWTPARLLYEGERRYRALSRRLGGAVTEWAVDKAYASAPALVSYIQQRVTQWLP